MLVDFEVERRGSGPLLVGPRSDKYFSYVLRVFDRGASVYHKPHSRVDIIAQNQKLVLDISYCINVEIVP